MNSIAIEKNNPRTLNAWASYDWANSVYNLTITAAVFPVYYAAVTQEYFGGDMVQFFGKEILGSVLYDYGLAFSYLIAAFLSPILAGAADYTGNKKGMMKFFTYLGSAACISLFFFEGYNIELGIIGAIIASIGYSGAIVFYLAYLPEIATDDQMDKVSAKGYSWGYIGSIIQLATSLLLILKPDWFGIPEGTLASRISFLLVGLWWMGFAQIAFRRLPDSPTKPKAAGQKSFDWMSKGFKEIKGVWQEMKPMTNTKRYLFAYFFYSMGAQSIMLLATIFAAKVLGLPSEKLLATILLLQVVAIVGAYLFAYVSKIWGNRISLVIMLVIWMLLCGLGYYMAFEWQFYILSAGTGLLMGGFHIGRSTYAKLIPEGTEDTTSYFSFFDVMDKVAVAMGTFTFGLLEFLTHNIRYGTLMLMAYFAVATLVMWSVKIPRGAGQLQQ